MSEYAWQKCLKKTHPSLEIYVYTKNQKDHSINNRDIAHQIIIQSD